MTVGVVQMVIAWIVAKVAVCAIAKTIAALLAVADQEEAAKEQGTQSRAFIVRL